MIQRLKTSNINEGHWKKLMQETGMTFTVNIKTITLEQVFNMELQNYPEKVDEICNEAYNED